MRIRAALLLALLASIAGCQTPPRSAYVRDSGSQEQPGEQISLGSNTAGEAYTQEKVSTPSAG